MSSESKIFIGIIGVTLAAIVGGVLLFSSQPAKTYGSDVLAPTTAEATGSATPKVTLVEFSDFECPSCKAAEPLINKVINTYSSSGLRFVYRNFPLPQHPFAAKSAAAAEAAGKQGKFWEMRDLLFFHQDEMSDDLFPKLAQQLGLDVNRFNADRASQSVLQKVADDEAAGNQLGINATPTFFLNGKMVDPTSIGNLDQLVANSLK